MCISRKVEVKKNTQKKRVNKVQLLHTVCLFPGDPLDVDHELAAVAGLHLALAVLECSPYNHHLITLPDRERSDLIVCT